MFLPIGDEPNPRGRAYVNVALIAINVVAFIAIAVPAMGRAADPTSSLFAEYMAFLRHAMPDLSAAQLAREISAYDLVVFEYGYRPSDPSLLTLFTSMFMHGGWMHLIGNMLFLYIYGDNVEHRLGRLGYLVTYLACGAAATFFFALLANDSPTPLVGASGAISGVLGLYFVWFPNNVVKMLMVFGFVNVIRIPARWVLGFYLVVDNLLPLLAGPTGGGGVAHGAHIGGFIAGFALAWGLQKAGAKSESLGKFAKTDRETALHRPVFTPVREPTRLRVNDAQAMRVALASGNWHDAYRAYVAMSLAERDKIDKADAIRFADWLTDQGDYDVASALLRRFIELHAGDPPWLARAHLRAGLIDLHFKNDSDNASDHFHKVIELGASHDMQQVARNALAHARSTRSQLN